MSQFYRKYDGREMMELGWYPLIGDVQNYLRLESTLSVTNEIRALALDACSRLVYPLCRHRVSKCHCSQRDQTLMINDIVSL